MNWAEHIQTLNRLTGQITFKFQTSYGTTFIAFYNPATRKWQIDNNFVINSAESFNNRIAQYYGTVRMV